jgi:glycosyltransferase involved in cell wall biosynthesis
MPASSLPLVSIVTPCYNGASFIQQTIESVLSQDYPNLEYIVMDGGSRDGSLEIIKRFSDRLLYWSAADSGAADAINRGFEQSHGTIFAWISADDLYEAGAITKAVGALLECPGVLGVYGDACWIDLKGAPIAPYPTKAFDPEKLAEECFICQPACFLRSDAFREAGMLDTELQTAFDYDFWIRCSRLGQLQYLPERIAGSRMHEQNKTLGSRSVVFEEAIEVLRRHYGYVPAHWLHSYCSYLLDGRDQFFEPARLPRAGLALSLPVGCWYNRRHPIRYVQEWAALAGFRAVESFRRRLKFRSTTRVGRHR